MNKILLLICAIVLSMVSFGQSRLITAQFQKNNQPGVENAIPFPEKTVSNTIEDAFQKIGYRGKDTKGYITFKGVHLNELGPDIYDLYFKTDRKSRKEKDITTVTLLISSGYEKFIGDTTNATVINNAKRYLDNLTLKVAAYDLELQINEQEGMVKKASKKLANTIDDGLELQKKKTKIDNNISDNLKDQITNKTSTDKEEQILQILKDKRKQ